MKIHVLLNGLLCNYSKRLKSYFFFLLNNGIKMNYTGSSILQRFSDHAAQTILTDKRNATYVTLRNSCNLSYLCQNKFD